MKNDIPVRRILWIGGIQNHYLRRAVLLLTQPFIMLYIVLERLLWLCLRLLVCPVLALLEILQGIVILLQSFGERWQRPLVLYNPYTGTRRDRRDINSDPYGILIMKPTLDESMEAMRSGCFHEWKSDYTGLIDTCTKCGEERA